MTGRRNGQSGNAARATRSWVATAIAGSGGAIGAAFSIFSKFTPEQMLISTLVGLLAGLLIWEVAIEGPLREERQREWMENMLMRFDETLRRERRQKHRMGNYLHRVGGGVALLLGEKKLPDVETVSFEEVDGKDEDGSDSE